MAFIYETDNFIVESFDAPTPHVSREDGGHIRIRPKVDIVDRTILTPALAIECMRLTMIVGEALKSGMTNRGIEIARVNYHDMGNWAFKTGKQPFFHIHIYGRAFNAKEQPYQKAVYLPDRSTGFYKGLEPLNEDDIKGIKKQIEEILQRDKYQNFQ